MGKRNSETSRADRRATGNYRTRRSKLRMQTARLIAILYVMYVALSGMAVPGNGDAAQGTISAKAAGNYKVTVSNYDALADADNAGCKVTASLDSTNRVAKFGLNYAASTNKLDGEFEIYSVKYKDQEYYYSASAVYDGTTPGLYYSSSDKKWKFVFPSALTADATIAVQLTTQLNMLSSCNAYDASYTAQSGATAGSTISFSDTTKSKVSSALSELGSSDLYIQYYDYNGKFTSSLYSSSNMKASSSSFVYDSLQFSYKETDTTNGFDAFELQYGGSVFGGGTGLLQVWAKDKPTIAVYRKPGTNQVVVESSDSAATKHMQVYNFKTYSATTGESATGTAKTVTEADNKMKISDDLKGYGKLELPDTGLYLCGDQPNSSNTVIKSYIKACYATYNKTNGNGAVTDFVEYTWAGPKSSSLGNAEVGTIRQITENLTDVNGKSSDYAGTVIKVNNTEVTDKTPYTDEYVKIDCNGNVAVLKAGDSQTYKLTTQSKYTMFKQDDDTIAYQSSTDNASYDPSDITYGTQDWTVTLTLTPTASSSESTTTQQTATTTQAATTTQKATTTTQAATTTQKATTTTQTATTTTQQATTTTQQAATTQTPVKTITDIEVTSPTKMSYDSYTEVKDLILSGGSVTPSYSDGTSGTAVSLTSDMLSLGTASSEEKNGTTTYTVPVTVKYKGVTKENAFSYTYSVVNSYSVTCSSDGSAITSDKTTATCGQKISLTVPQSNSEQSCRLSTVTVKTDTGETVTATQSSENAETWTFTMPAADVTVTATYLGISAIELTMPKIAMNAYQKAEISAEMPLGSYTVVYGTGTDAQCTDAISMQTSQYTLGAPTEVKSGSTVTVTVPVTVTVSYGNFTQTGTFSYQYTYEASDYTAALSTITPLSNQENVVISKAYPQADETVSVRANASADCAYATITVKTESGAEVSVSSTEETDGTVVGTFTMPAASVEVSVSYLALSSITVQAPTKTAYDSYTEAEDLDYSGGTVTAVYGSGTTAKSRTFSMKADTGVDNGLTFACQESAVKTTTDAYTEYAVPVRVSYGGFYQEFSYTYQQTAVYPVSLQVTPADCTYAGEVSLSKTTASYGEKVTLTLPPATDEKYTLDKVTYTVGNTSQTLTAQQGVYTVTVTGDTVITVYYTVKGDEEVVPDPDPEPQPTTSETDATTQAAATTTKAAATTKAATTTQAAVQTTTETTTEALVAPETAEVEKVTAKKKKLTISWAAQEDATAYEVYVSTKKNSGYEKAKTILATPDQVAYSCTISSYNGKALKKKTAYYVKLRAINGVQQLQSETAVQTVKCKKKGRLTVTLKAQDDAVSYQVFISAKKKSGYKKAFTVQDTGKKKYTKTLSRCGGSKVKKGRKYYIRVVTTKDVGTYAYGPYSEPVKIQCK